jgi:hypothetical protein
MGLDDLISQKPNMMWLRMAIAISGTGRMQWTILKEKFLPLEDNLHQC